MDQTGANVTIQIYNNLKPQQGFTVHFRKQETNYKKFLQMASEVLSINAKKIYDGIGEEITQIAQINQNKDYYISAGEKFNPQIEQNKIQGSTHSNSMIKGTCQNISISILGGAAVGKSNVTMRFVKNQFYEHYDPTLQDDYIKKLSLDGTQYVVKVKQFFFLQFFQITDTSGQEDYLSLRSQWMKDKDGLIFLYSINSRDSFEEVYNLITLFNAQEKNPEKPVTIIIVANKQDLEMERAVMYDEGQKLANDFNALFIECSAKSGFNVEKLFLDLIRKISIERQNMIVSSRSQMVKSKRQGKENTDRSFFARLCTLI